MPVALVTGAAQGLGKAIAQRLASDGFTVAVNDLPGDSRLEELAAAIGGLALPADISDPQAPETSIGRAVSELGRLDVLVGNAAYMRMSPFLDHDPADFWRHIHVNLTGHARLAQACVAPMTAAGGGRIVFISSGWGVVGHPNAAAYAASKAGLISLTKGLGRELGPRGILTNAIAPAFIDTEQLQVDADDAGVTLDEIKARYALEVPVGHIATPADIAGAVSFLAGPAGGGMVGQILQPTGGVTRTRA
jgi:2-hydroxycyclohexanecarboxyl-CoA dehydrogenase